MFKFFWLIMTISTTLNIRNSKLEYKDAALQSKCLCLVTTHYSMIIHYIQNKNIYTMNISILKFQLPKSKYSPEIC